MSAISEKRQVTRACRLCGETFWVTVGHKGRSRQYCDSKCSARGSTMKTKYGITPCQFRAMLVKQNHQCAICKEPKGLDLCVDHCHTSGQVRALLCGPCNRGLGHFADNPDHLRAAITFLEEHGRRKQKT